MGEFFNYYLRLLYLIYFMFLCLGFLGNGIDIVGFLVFLILQISLIDMSCTLQPVLIHFTHSLQYSCSHTKQILTLYKNPHNKQPKQENKKKLTLSLSLYLHPIIILSHPQYNIIIQKKIPPHHPISPTMDKQVQADIDRIIQRLLSQSQQQKQTKLTESQLKSIITTCRTIFLEQPMLLELSAPIKIVGDIHGQFNDLLRIFQNGGYPPHTNYLFLGDYVDRGQNSLETIVLLMCYKIKFPENFFMLRGNHQAAQINKLYGFYDQCKRKQSIKIWKMFTDCFNTMPIAALIQQKILCMHGGISPQLKKVKKILSLNRPTQIPSSGLLCDILWSDPAEQIKGFQQNNQRGIGQLFGISALSTFLQENDLDLICRSHQIVQEGYEFFGKRQLVTIFSAPNYCSMFQNWGAIMSVNNDLICSFEVIKPNPNSKVDKNQKSDNKKRPKTPKYIN